MLMEWWLERQYWPRWCIMQSFWRPLPQDRGHLIVISWFLQMRIIKQGNQFF